MKDSPDRATDSEAYTIDSSHQELRKNDMQQNNEKILFLQKQIGDLEAENRELKMEYDIVEDFIQNIRERCSDLDIDINNLNSKKDKFCDSFDLDKMQSEEYINALLKLHKGGIKIDPQFVSSFDLQRGESEEYINALLKLHKVGIKIDFVLITALSPDKGESDKFIQELINKKKQGKAVDARMINQLCIPTN